jgi:hypothetical protein
MSTGTADGIGFSGAGRRDMAAVSVRGEVDGQVKKEDPLLAGRVL